MNRYWIEKTPSNFNYEKNKKEQLELFQNIDEKYKRMYNKNQFDLEILLNQKNLGNYPELVTDKITNISLLYNPILPSELNLVKLFDLIKVDRIIPYVNFISDKRKQSKIKIYEPAYYGNDVEINELMLKQWREETLSTEEINYLTKKIILSLNVNLESCI